MRHHVRDILLLIVSSHLIENSFSCVSQPPSIDNARLPMEILTGTSPYPVGTTYSYTCEDGFIQVGSLEITCMITGVFTTVSGSCEVPLPCESEPPVVANGNISPVLPPPYVHGSLFTYTCISGFEFQGTSVTECGSIDVGQFPNPGICFPVCSGPPPNLQNADIVDSQQFYFVGDTVTYECSPGFSFSGGSGSPTSSCQSSRSFSDVQGICNAVLTLEQSINMVFVEAFLDLNSPQSQELINQFVGTMQSIVSNIFGIIDILVKSLNRGSVIIEYDLIFDETTNVSQESILLDINDGIQSGNFNTSAFNGPPTTVANEEIIEDVCGTSNLSFSEVKKLSQNQELFPTTIICGSDLIGLSIDACNITTLGLDPRYLVVTGPGEKYIDPDSVERRCQPNLLKDTNGSLVATFLLFNIMDCEPNITHRDDMLIVEYSIRNFRPLNNGYIDRFFQLCIPFSCEFKRFENVSTSIAVISIVRKLVFSPTDEEGDFEVTFSVFKDEQCNEPLVSVGGSAPIVMVPDFIYFKLEVGVEALILQAYECWASSSGDANDGNRYSIITAGNAASSDPRYATVVLINYKSNIVKAGFPSFVWTNVSMENQRIFIHCSVFVCEPALDDVNCTEVAGKRRKRLLEPTPSNIISIGPISLEDPCEFDQKCEHFCLVVNNVGICSCKDGYTLVMDKYCKYDVKSPISIEKMQNENIHILLMMVIIFLSILLIGLICIKKNTRSFKIDKNFCNSDK